MVKTALVVFALWACPLAGHASAQDYLKQRSVLTDLPKVEPTSVGPVAVAAPPRWAFPIAGAALGGIAGIVWASQIESTGDEMFGKEFTIAGCVGIGFLLGSVIALVKRD